MTYRKKAARAATPANARLPLTVEAAPVNLDGLGLVGVLVFFAVVALMVPTAVEVRLARVVGQALTVTVTTDGAATELETLTGVEATTGMEELEYTVLLAGQLVTDAAQAI